MKELLAILCLCASTVPAYGQYFYSGRTSSSPGGGVTSVMIAGTASQIAASGTCTITSTGTCTLSLLAAQILGTDNSVAGTIQLANGSAAAHTILGSAATTSNTILGPATVIANNHMVGCSTAGTVCTFIDLGAVPAAGVSSFSGDGVFITNSGSTGPVTATLGTLPIANGGTNAITAAAARISLFPTASEVGDLVYCATFSAGCTSWALLAGNTSGTKYLQETSTGVPSFTAPSVTQIVDSNGNPTVASVATTTAVDYITATNAATANPATVTLTAAGSDSNVTLGLTSKGTSPVSANGLTVSANGLAITCPTGGACTFTANGSNGTKIGGGSSGVNIGNGMVVGGSSGIIATYDNINTSGIGVPFITAVSNVTNQTASQTTVTLGSSLATGSYAIRYYFDEKTACTTVATGGVLMTISWTDGTLARTFTSSTLSADTTGIGADYVSGVLPIFAGASSTISYTTTYSATCGTGGPFAYDLHASLERTQ